MTDSTEKDPVTVECAAVRSLCSGSSRALRMVAERLRAGGGKLCCLHELLHNRAINQELAERGVCFIGKISDAPAGGVVIVSAHGAPPELFREADRRGIKVLDASCPRVKKLHELAAGAGDLPVVLAGHSGHPEVLGTLGYARNAALVGSAEDVAALPEAATKVVFIAQTTLEIAELEAIRCAMHAKYGTKLLDCAEVCPATRRRQQAVRELAERCDLVLVAGSPHSSNSRRLVECARRAGARAELLDGAAALTAELISGARRIGLSAGASVSEEEFQRLLARLVGEFGCLALPDPAKTSKDAIL